MSDTMSRRQAVHLVEAPQVEAFNIPGPTAGYLTPPLRLDPDAEALYHEHPAGEDLFAIDGGGTGSGGIGG